MAEVYAFLTGQYMTVEPTAEDMHNYRNYMAAKGCDLRGEAICFAVPDDATEADITAMVSHAFDPATRQDYRIH